MKRLAKSYFPAFLFFVLFSCGEEGDIDDINIDTILVKSLPVVATTTNEMTYTVVLDATTDPEIKKYADKIKNYEITELLFAIENYQADTGDEIYFNGNIGFSKKSGNQATSSCAISPLNVTHVAETGAFPISTCNTIVDEISEVLKTDNAVKIYLTGTFTKSTVIFDLKVTIKVKVTANP